MSNLANLALDGGDPRLGDEKNLALDGGDLSLGDEKNSPRDGKNSPRDGSDPCLGDEKNPSQYVVDQGYESGMPNGFSIEAAQVHNDPNILFEEYLHYAEITRAEERVYEGNNIKRNEPFSLVGVIKNRFSKGHKHDINATVEGNQIVTTHNDW